MNSWDKGKKLHTSLSKNAAEQYDQIYEDMNFATGSYMQYELRTIKQFINCSPSHDLALVLGCGTGRDSFVLAEYFEQVFAYDFSEEMIRIANNNKLKKKVGNVLFEIKDIESAPFDLDDNSVSFISAGFGMGSFIKNIDNLLKEIERILQPEGVAVFSFYNKDSLLNQLDLEWEPALSASIIKNEESIEVTFNSNKYKISAKAYSTHEIKNIFTNNFKLLRINTFPTISSLLPQSLFLNENMRKVCTEIDESLSTNLNEDGFYILSVYKKEENNEYLDGYNKSLKLLKKYELDKKIIKHSIVKNMEDVYTVIDETPDRMLKSILITSKKENIFFLFGLSASDKLDMSKIAKIMNESKSNIRFATPLEIKNLTGFIVGAIPPFAMPKEIPIVIDNTIMKQHYIWCGTGKETESLKISIEELKKISMCNIENISK